MQSAVISTDLYVAQLERYCVLKDRYRWSLSSKEKDELAQLEYDLELDPDEVLNVNSATAIVRQISKEAIKILSSHVEELEDTLHEMDIWKMRQLQKIMNKNYLDTFFERQMKRIKMKLMNSSEELKQRGILYRMSLVFYDHFVPIIIHIGVSVATNVFQEHVLASIAKV